MSQMLASPTYREDLLADGWEIPVPLTGPPPAPPFPLEGFPDWLKDMVLGVATFTQTDPTMAGTVALAVLSACAGGRIEVEPAPGWRETSNVFIACVADPGERKSPVHGAMTAPLWEAEKTLIAKTAATRSEQAALKDITAQRATHLRAAAAKADDAQADQLIADAVAAEQAAEAIVVPTRPCLISDDSTPEPLATLMAENGGRMAVLSDEGGIFDMLAGRYSANPWLEPYLKGHVGNPMRTGRSSRQETIARPALTIGVMIQPSVLRKFGTDNNLVGRGMVARFLLTLPASMAGWRNIDPDPVPQAVRATYHQHIHDLAVTLATWDSPCILRLTPAAQRVRIDQATQIEHQLRPGGVLRETLSWGNKFTGTALRLATLLHLANNPNDAWEQDINARIVEAGFQLGWVLFDHYQAAMHTIATDPKTDTTQRVLNVLIDNNMQAFTRREIQRKAHRQLPTAKDAAAALDTLTQLGWIRPQEKGYQLHPHAAEYRKAGDTVTNAINTNVFAAHKPSSPVTKPDDTSATAVTKPGAAS